MIATALSNLDSDMGDEGEEVKDNSDPDDHLN